jgi:hypothetical protein
VPEENYVVEVLVLYKVHHVGDVGFEVDLGRGEVHPLAQASEGSGIGVVAVFSQPAGDLLPALAPQPAAAHQHVSPHSQNLLVGINAMVVSNPCLYKTSTPNEPRPRHR